MSGILTEAVLNRPDFKRCQIDVVIEGGHRNLAEVERAFQRIKLLIRPQLGELLGSLTVGTREEFVELCAADSLASFGWGIEIGQSPTLQLKSSSRADASYRGNFYRLEVGEESLTDLAVQVLEGRDRA